MNNFAKVFLLVLSLASMNSFALQKQQNEAEAQRLNQIKNEFNEAQEDEVAKNPVDVKKALLGVADAFKKKAKKACFKKGSLLLNEAGECQAIEDVQAGDVVLSFDEESKEIVKKRIEEVFRVPTDYCRDKDRGRSSY